jgi:hypothetical protein
MGTFSVSVSPETKARLRKAADRAYGGNVSALIEAMALLDAGALIADASARRAGASPPRGFDRGAISIAGSSASADSKRSLNR